MELILPPRKVVPLRRNIGNENKKENEKNEEISSEQITEFMELDGSDNEDSSKQKVEHIVISLQVISGDKRFNVQSKQKMRLFIEG